MSNDKRKLRVLWCGEASFLNTGYSVYAREVLSRLYKTDKYIVAELGCYVSIDDQRCQGVPWKFYANLPSNGQDKSSYNSSQTNQFGEWRFDEVCLDFRPDVVIDIRDWWMMEHQERSAFRDFYRWAIMPTVDSSPQQEQYINTYMNANAVFTYSEFGRDVLEEDSNGKIKVLDIASPAANYERLKPKINKKKHRENFGFMDDITIVGTIMRNQRRKLYPNLLSSFRTMLDENPEFENKRFLYLHTSYPDLGWEIPYFLRRYNMSANTLLTYKCASCNHFFPSFYQGGRVPCQGCGEYSAVMPNTAMGVSEQELSEIINWFDLYVQYSICEGFGMPQVEAAACGVPVLTVDYSAMSSVGKKIKADFIKVKDFFWDSPTHSLRAIPDDRDLIDKMKSFIDLPQSMKDKKGMDSYVSSKKNYSWDKTSKIWEKYLDEVKIIEHEHTWDSPSREYMPKEKFPNNIPNHEFVEWGVKHLWGEPTKTNSYVAIRLLRDLNYGKSMGQSSIYYSESSYDSQPAYRNFTIDADILVPLIFVLFYLKKSRLCFRRIVCMQFFV